MSDGLIPFWDSNPLSENFYLPYGPITNAFALCAIDDYTLPGVSVVDCNSSIRLDIKQAPGRQFATITGTGMKPIDVNIVTTIWSPNQWIQWQLIIMPMVRPFPGAKYSKQPIIHKIASPVSEFHDIEFITVETITGPTKCSLYGAREMKIKAIQWDPASNSKNVATKTAAGVVIPPSNSQSALANKPSNQVVPADSNANQ
jgi:hypothetical protein